MTNADWIQKSGIRFSDLKWRASGKEEFDIFAGAQGWVGNIKMNSGVFADPRLMWLDMLHEEPSVLDDAEKRYLKAVIKPWQGNAKKINYIKKQEGTCTGRIIINTYYGNMEFPAFDAGTMYKGMERGREYSPEELGL